MDASETFSREQIAAVKELVNTQAEDNKKLQEEQAAKVEALLGEVNSRLDVMKNELAEKVHSENVKSYRNTQDLFKEFGESLEKLDAIDRNAASARGYVKCLTWLSGINFVVLVGYILYSLGVFNF